MLITETLSGAICFRNGTQTKLSDKNVISASCKQKCCQDGRFEIGGVYASVLSMSCRLTGTNAFNIRGAKIVLYSQYAGETNPFCIGTFWVTEAGRNGEIFNLTALDAAGWLDSSYMNAPGQNIYSNFAKYLVSLGYGTTLDEWCAEMTGIVNSLIKRLTGIEDERENILVWGRYPETLGRIYTNHYIYSKENGRLATFFLLDGMETENSDSPRDLYRYIAELIGGFIYARPGDGQLTFGQFGEPLHSYQEIYTHEIEYDSCEIADFRLLLYSTYAQAEYSGGTAESAVGLNRDPDFTKEAVFRVRVESNPFLDGFAQYHLEDMTVYNSVAQQLWNGLSMNMDGESTGNDWYQFHVRPFHCKVHSEKRFHLGQKIRIHYQAPEDAEEKFYESIITSITWTFRGGHSIACGGEDNRTMADCLRVSKADKALKEARSRCAALEKKIS